MLLNMILFALIHWHRYQPPVVHVVSAPHHITVTARY